MNDLIKRESSEIMQFDNEQIELIKTTIAKGATDNELKLFLQVCKRTGLDPFSKQIYAIKRGGQMTMQTGIDGYRLIAERSGAYAGSDEPVFEYHPNDKMKSRPERVTVTVYKIVQGVRCAFKATAIWYEYCPFEPKNLWKTMPHGQLAKCAEALALRKAFPHELSDLRSNDEMQQADDDLEVTKRVVENVTGDYEDKEQLLKSIRDASTIITKNCDVAAKMKFISDIWGVQSYSDLKLKNEEKLKILLDKLKGIINNKNKE